MEFLCHASATSFKNAHAQSCHAEIRPTGPSWAGTDYDSIEIVRGEEGRILSSQNGQQFPVTSKSFPCYLIKIPCSVEQGTGPQSPGLLHKSCLKSLPIRPERAKFPVILPVSSEFDL
jgi:hypothetical protein